MFARVVVIANLQNDMLGARLHNVDAVCKVFSGLCERWVAARIACEDGSCNKPLCLAHIVRYNIRDSSTEVTNKMFGLVLRRIPFAFRSQSATKGKPDEHKTEEGKLFSETEPTRYVKIFKLRAVFFRHAHK